MVSQLRRVLILGGGGMLGRAWRELCESRGIAYDAPGRDVINLAEPQSLGELDLQPYSAVINCAAWTDVDGAEEHEAEAAVINCDAVAALAKRCAQTQTLLVHYSTDYIFNGQTDQPWPVDGAIEPINAYGRTKALGEKAIAEAGTPHLIVRTSWLYAPWGKNFVLTMARLTQDKPQLRVVNDQRGRPTSCRHLAATTLALIKQGKQGTWHVTDSEECTWYDFTCVINELLGGKCDVQPCTSEEFPRPAPRPAYSVLDITQTESAVGAMPTWRENTRQVLQEAGLITS